MCGALVRTSESIRTLATLSLVVPLLNPKFAFERSATLCEFRVRGTTRRPDCGGSLEPARPVPDFCAGMLRGAPDYPSLGSFDWRDVLGSRGNGSLRDSPAVMARCRACCLRRLRFSRNAAARRALRAARIFPFPPVLSLLAMTEAQSTPAGAPQRPKRTLACAPIFPMARIAAQFHFKAAPAAVAQW
jgi:hypothetical protein